MAPTAAVSQSALQAEKLRQDGNTYFKKDRFGAAIDAYTEAITLCPNVAVYWTNRALCHRKRNKLPQSLWELQIHPISPRVHHEVGAAVEGYAHYMLGLALQQRHGYAEGIKELERALDLGRGANPQSYIVEEIWQEVARAKYLEWERESTKRAWELQTLKEACESALKEKLSLDSSKIEGFLDEIIDPDSAQLEALGQVFEKAAEADLPTEVPDYLCCKITLDIFRDPVITPSGVSYERAVILEHIEKVGRFDPITREPLHLSQLIPNLAIKEAVHAFLDKHGWAYKMN